MDPLLLWFEIRNRIVRLSSFSYFSVFFALSFLIAIALGGAFKGANFGLGFSDKLPINSPVLLHYIICATSYFGLLIIAPIFGQSINQDFENGFHQVLFASPIRKSTYFFIRYLGSFLSCLAILLSIALGIYTATFMPFLDPTLVIENHLWYYLSPYLTNLLPNLFTFGAIFFAIAALFKRMAPVYVASISVFMGTMISQSFIGSLDNKWIATLLEPFGIDAARLITRYWSLTEQTTQVIPLTSHLLYNRLLWGSIGLLALTLAYLAFNPFKLPKERKKTTSPTHASHLKPQKTPLTPRSPLVFWRLALSEFKQAFSNVMFLILLAFGIIYIFAVSGQIGKIYGTETLPVTYHVLEVVGATFSLFVACILSFYAGELIWKDKEQRVHELIDAKPVSNFFLYLSKFFSLCFVQLFLLSIIFISSILIQIFKGYTHFEWTLYAKHLLFYTLPSWTLTSITALFIQTLAKNKYIGHSIMIAYFVLMTWLPSFGLDHRLYLINTLPPVIYSDMNQFGTLFPPFCSFALYWGSFNLLLATLSVLFWKRGTRLRSSLRLKPIHLTLITASLSLFIALGSWIYYNTNILNHYRTSSEKTQQLVDYELKYKHFEKQPHPCLISISTQIDLFPEKQAIHAQGLFTYKNTTVHPIETLLLNIPENTQLTQLSWSHPNHIIEEKPSLKIFRLNPPLQPHEKVHLTFTLSVQPKGFENDDFSKKIVENGTFFYGTDFFPTIGYNSHQEVPTNSIRKKYGLPEKPRMPKVDDRDALQHHYVSHEGNWIDFETTLSTTPDQIALAPGNLERQWEENNRRYFKYKTDHPILPFYAILSGRFAVTRDHWNDVQIEIYHHPNHTQNIARMILSVQKSLDYYTQHFSPYQFKHLRIIEFPRYQTFAQSFPNTIPYSEALGFIAKVDPNDPNDIDYPFYVTAHEVAHQWWAHQVIGGEVQGATMLSESLAQYSALMVMEKEFGPTQMKRFLKYELDGYLHGRSGEPTQELPLVLNENQAYIHYQKGSLVFYALKDALGESTVNQILSNYIKDVAFQQPPFTRATDLLQRFKLTAPHSLIEDLFETITFYDNRTDKVAFKKTSNKYEVEIQTTNRKWRANDQGIESEVPLNDLIDIGIYDTQNNLRYLQKHNLTSGSNTLTIEVDFEPSRAGVDPLNKLIDKIPEDKILKATPSFSNDETI